MLILQFHLSDLQVTAAEKQGAHHGVTFRQTRCPPRYRIVHSPLGGNQVEERFAQLLRKPLLDRITAQGRVHDSIAWWASRLSERNTMVSPLFLRCCYLQVGQMELKNQHGTLCVIAESWAVLES